MWEVGGEGWWRGFTSQMLRRPIGVFFVFYGALVCEGRMYEEKERPQQGEEKACWSHDL
jgi:hypothetical protein